MKSKRIITAINMIPNGVQSMSMDLPGLVETSMNLGVVELTADSFVMRASVRSSVPSAKEFLVNKLVYITEFMGGTVTLAGQYPAWPYSRKSKLRDTCVKIYKQQYKKNPSIQLLHAGLECGIFADKLPGLDCISFGPNLIDIHTPNEHMSISSVARVWEFLKAVLADKTA